MKLKGSAVVESHLTLLFFTTMGIDFAVDAAPVTAMTTVPSAIDEKNGIVRIDEIIDFPETPVIYDSPRALRVETGKKKFYLVVNAPREMPLAVPVAQIQPFPLLCEPFMCGTPLWAVLPMDERLVLLLDLFAI